MDTLSSHSLVLAVVVGLPLVGIIARFFKKSFLEIAKYYSYIAIFAVIVVMDSIFFPFIGGKDWFFRFTIELGLISVILWWAFEAKKGEVKELFKPIFKNPLFLAVSTFVVAILLSTLFAYDHHAAFWSNFERGEGAFQFLHYYIFFILLITLFKKLSDWRALFKLSLVATGIMIIYGLLGNFGAQGFIGPYSSGSTPSGFWQILTNGRFQGSLGNPAYVAPYLIFSMFFAAFLWLTRKNDARLSGKSRGYFYGSIIAIFLFFFILSQTRGAFLGFGAGIFMMLVYFIFSKNKAIKKWSIIALSILVILGATGYLVKDLSFIKQSPEGRLLQISVNDTTAQTRFWVWGSAWQGFLERPVFGWGLENFTTVYDRFFNTNFFVPGQNGETWFDRAHSVFFDYLTETGVVGLISYLGIFVVFYWEFFKKKTKNILEKIEGRSPETSSVLIRGLVFAVPIAYLVQGVAIFDVLPMYIVLFVFLAFSYYYFSAEKNEKISNIK
jgi:O-antigen ligase